MKGIIMIRELVFVFLFSSFLLSQSASKEEIEKGISFIPTRVYSEKENQELLALYKMEDVISS